MAVNVPLFPASVYSAERNFVFKRTQDRVVYFAFDVDFSVAVAIQQNVTHITLPLCSKKNEK